MEETLNLFLGLPELMQVGIFKIIIVLVSGLIISVVATFYLKNKDVITRIAGIILEKSVNSKQEILDSLEEKLSINS